MEGAWAVRARAGRVELRLMGTPEATVDREMATFRTRKTLALLAYLALNPGAHPRESIAALLWPEVEQGEARISLRTALTYLRQALGESADAVLVASRDFIGIDPQAIDLDVETIRCAEPLLRGHASPTLRKQLQAAVHRYRGPLLAGLSLSDAPEFEAWLEAQRTELRNLATEVLNRLAALHLESGDLKHAFGALEQWTRVNPDEELAWQRLIELHLNQGDWIGARHAWERYRFSLAELDATPSELMSSLYKRIVGPAANNGQTSTRGVANLDFRHTPFVGRPREWAALMGAYRRVQAGGSAVVVIEGQAGVGKTRLAFEFMAAIKDEGADVIAGRGFDGNARLAYGALIEGLRPRLEAENAPDDLLSDLWLAELARLLPELRERYPDLAVEPEDTLTRSRVFEAVTRLVIALERRRPLAILLDDAQWVDEDTGDLLSYAMRRWVDTGSRVLLVLVARPLGESQAAWDERLSVIESETTLLRLKLEPLAPDDVTHLVEMLSGRDRGGSGTVDDFGRWLAKETGGRPRPVVQTLRELFDKGVLRVRALSDSHWAIELPDEHFMRQVMFAPGG